MGRFLLLQSLLDGCQPCARALLLFLPANKEKGGNAGRISNFEGVGELFLCYIPQQFAARTLIAITVWTPNWINLGTAKRQLNPTLRSSRLRNAPESFKTPAFLPHPSGPSREDVRKLFGILDLLPHLGLIYGTMVVHIFIWGFYGGEGDSLESLHTSTSGRIKR